MKDTDIEKTFKYVLDFEDDELTIEWLLAQSFDTLLELVPHAEREERGIELVKYVIVKKVMLQKGFIAIAMDFAYQK